MHRLWRRTRDAMDCRATDLHTASFPSRAWFSRRHDGLPEYTISYTQSSVLSNVNLRNHWWGGARKRVNQKAQSQETQ
jgi:hypothetical protein